MKPRRPSILILSLVVVAGCAPSGRGPGPTPDARYPEPPLVLPETAGFAASWAGQYEGAGRVFRQSHGQWRDQVPMRLDIRPLLNQRLGITGHADADSFFFLVTPADSLKLEGEAQQSTARYTYTLSRTAEGISGSVAAYSQEEQVGPFLPGGEWVFEVSPAAGH